MKRSHRDLLVWQEAMLLVEDVYRFTAVFPAQEQFGLVTQLRRAAVSVPSNIAEGFARATTKELLHFLSIAAGSLSELDTQVELALRLGLRPSGEAPSKRIDDVAGQLMALSTSLKRRATQ
jgi:four helix bundle protein